MDGVLVVVVVVVDGTSAATACCCASVHKVNAAAVAVAAKRLRGARCKSQDLRVIEEEEEDKDKDKDDTSQGSLLMSSSPDPKRVCLALGFCSSCMGAFFCSATLLLWVVAFFRREILVALVAAHVFRAVTFGTIARCLLHSTSKTSGILMADRHKGTLLLLGRIVGNLLIGILLSCLLMNLDVSPCGGGD